MKKHYFATIDDYMKWYNEVKSHLSLEFNGRIETPEQAFWRKLPPEKLLGIAMEVVLK